MKSLLASQECSDIHGDDFIRLHRRENDVEKPKNTEEDGANPFGARRPAQLRLAEYGQVSAHQKQADGQCGGDGVENNGETECARGNVERGTLEQQERTVTLVP